MVRFIIRRTLLAVATLLAVSVVSFSLFFAVPSDPARLMCAKDCDAEQINQTRENLGLNEPLVTQYSDYMSGIFVGRTIGKGAMAQECDAPCFGYSYRTNEAVWDMMKGALPTTVSIAIGAWVIQTSLGVGLGVLAALRRGKFLDKFAVGSTMFGQAMPTYLLAALLLMIFVYNTGLLSRPTYTSPFENPLAWAGGLILPWLSLALIGFAGEARMARATMLETLSEDFVRTARAKGLSKGVVHRKHALRASITPVVTMSGLNIGVLLGGAVITESVFGLQGLGRLTVQSVEELNMPIVMATVLLAAMFIVISTMIVDFLYAVIDPRVRL
ncbi:MAG TPA: ABC transporter permease [Candidatus Stackebrandtia faecavium]|nr:ABC transporter permease [Candidatus Stackebrandtia faecavium]